MVIHDFLFNSAKTCPEKVALVCEDGRFTYRELKEKSTRLANFLLDSGLRRGDRVAIYLENGMPAVVAIFAALKAGGAFMMVNPTTKKRKLDYLLRDSQASVLIAPEKHLHWVTPFLSRDDMSLSMLIGVGNEGKKEKTYANPGLSQILSREQKNIKFPDVIDMDLAALIYTSGSTGVPKGVTLVHRNMVSAAISITSYLQNQSNDIILNVLPLSFDYGLYQVLMAFMFGGRVILERSFNYSSSILNRLSEEKVTCLPGVPMIFNILIRMDGFSETNFPNIRYFTNTGAAIPVASTRRIRELFPKARFYSMYGLTECKRVSYLPPDMIDKKPESVGLGMPNEEAYIVREDGTRAAPGEIGELVVRGSNVMAGYWNDQEATDRVLKPGMYPWEKVLHTGDLFKMDKDGYLYFIGRKDDIIKSRGEKVSPREVEEVLHSIPGILEAAVVGIHDDFLGMSIQAHVVTNGSGQISDQDVIRFCHDNLENFMVPRTVVFHESLPKSPSGKIDKTALGPRK